jgi:hypothetical protein
MVQPKLDDRIPISLHNQVPTATVASTIPVQQGKGKAKQTSGSRQIKITRQLKVDEIVHMTHVPSTFGVPRTPTAILIDLSGSAHLLMTPSGAFMVVDRFIRAEVSSLTTYCPEMLIHPRIKNLGIPRPVGIQTVM